MQYQKYNSDISLELESNYPSRELLRRLGRISGTFLRNTGYDVFHLHDGGMLPFDIDAKAWFPALGPVVVHWHGSKIRRHKGPLLSRRAGHTFVSTPDLLEQVPGAEWLPNPILTEELPEAPEPANRTEHVRIVHAPTNKVAKGTAGIESAVRSLRQQGCDAELAILEGKTHAETLAGLAKADIVVDQVVPTVGTYGMVSIEAMAMGKPVVCYIRPEFYDEHFKGCPVVSAGFDNMAEALRELIEDPNRRAGLGARGREYARAKHGAEPIARRTIMVYEELLGGKRG
jgi:glycosyltransferase involved in cell wall biosynthesis